jgi:hypothetical protein
LSKHDDEQDAVQRSGSTGDRTPRVERLAQPLRLLLGLASLATAGAALWLFWVAAFVLPLRDPGHVPMWRAVAVCFLGYSALSWTYLLRGSRDATLRWALLAVSIVAIGLGLIGGVRIVRSAGAGGHFEGYLVLLSLILVLHGACAIGYAAPSRHRMKPKAPPRLGASV